MKPKHRMLAEKVTAAAEAQAVAAFAAMMGSSHTLSLARRSTSIESAYEPTGDGFRAASVAQNCNRTRIVRWLDRGYYTRLAFIKILCIVCHMSDRAETYKNKAGECHRYAVAAVT